jgi:hypothetical protein
MCLWRAPEKDITGAMAPVGAALDRAGLGYYELKMHKPWFDRGCLELVDEWKEAKLQWL